MRDLSCMRASDLVERLSASSAWRSAAVSLIVVALEIVLILTLNHD